MSKVELPQVGDRVFLRSSTLLSRKLIFHFAGNPAGDVAPICRDGTIVKIDYGHWEGSHAYPYLVQWDDRKLAIWTGGSCLRVVGKNTL